MTLKLIIGNKNYSSWSLRPWIAMKAAGIPFEEEVISLDAPDFKAAVGAVSGTGKVPVLIDGEVHGLGIAGDPRISGGEISRRRAVAGRCRGARACARDRHRDACRLPAAAQRLPDEHVRGR